MATERINDLLASKGLIEERLSNGGVDFTLDEARDVRLAHWLVGLVQSSRYPCDVRGVIRDGIYC